MRTSPSNRITICVAAFLLAVVVFLSGCGAQRTINLACDESYAGILSHEAELFSLVYARRSVVIYPVATTANVSPEALADKPLLPYRVRKPEELRVDLVVRQSLNHLAEVPFVDLYWCDSSLQRKELEELGIVMRAQRVGCVSPVILVPADKATENVSSLAKLFENRLRLGVVAPERSGLGEVSAMALGRVASDAWNGLVFEFESDIELTVAVESQIVDAVLIWNFQARRYTHPQEHVPREEPPREYLAIELFPDEPVVVPLELLTLTGGLNPAASALFVNFILSPATRNELNKLGLGSP
ncbi:MAG: substrate-binding domain-containing protein [Thermoguttaceae bacterium]